MITSILKKDLKRKKTMNIILLLFIILATIFVSTGASNVLTVVNGTNYYLDKAGVGTNVFITMGQDMHDKADGIFDDKDYVVWSKTENVFYTSEGAFLDENRNKLAIHNAAIIQCLEDSKINFFNLDNEIVKTVEPGKIYITSQMMADNNLKPGDHIIISIEGFEKEFEILGKLKDAFFGSVFLGNPRFLLSREDYDFFEQNEIVCQNYGGQICYQEVTDQKEFSKALAEIEGVSFRANRSMLTTCYMMDMIVAAIVLVASICLIIISFVVLKFTITFTITEEFREIGVMKAIGIKNHKIRRIYLVKYAAIAVIAAVIGFFISVPFSKLVIKSVSDNMVLGNDNSMLIQIVSSGLVVLVIVWYAYFCTGKLNKLTALDAIRSGQSGERFKKKSMHRIGKSKLRPTSYMAVNDILSSPKRYITIILAYMFCSILVFVIVNTAQTMNSDSFIHTFSKRSDVYYENTQITMNAMSGEGHAAMEEEMDKLEDEFKELGMPARCSVDVQFTFSVEFDGEINKILCQQGIRTTTDEYVYYEGTAPQNIHEIAITEAISDKTGAKIGDTVQITINDKKENYLVTAYFESMNQMGEIIRIYQDVPTDMGNASGAMAFQFDFEDHPNDKVIKERVKTLRDHFNTEKVFDAAEFAAECVQVADTMEAVSYLMLAITLIVAILISILMERSFISDETSEIALLKAVGFKNKHVTSWHIKRFLLVVTVAVLLGIILSVPATNLIITPVFRMMGMHQVHYKYNLLKILLIYPGIIMVVTAVSVSFTALYTNKIKSSDTANIE